jgi:hypothetical protein
LLEGRKRYSWIHPTPSSRRYELRDGDTTLLSLEWIKDGGTAARAVAGAESWTFKRIGYLNAAISIRQEGSETDLARFEPKASGSGLLSLENLDVEWKPNLWRAQWKWKSTGGSDLLIFKRNFASSEREGEMKVTEDAPRFRQTPMLALFGWYMIILIAEESTLLD